MKESDLILISVFYFVFLLSVCLSVSHLPEYLWGKITLEILQMEVQFWKLKLSAKIITFRKRKAFACEMTDVQNLFLDPMS